MGNDPARSGLQLTSTLGADGALTLQLEERPVTPPGRGEVVVRVEAAPINPSDLVTMLGPADPAQARFEGRPDRPVVVAQLSPKAAQAQAGRISLPLAVGLEGAGTVVAAGPGAEGLLGRAVGAFSLARGFFAQYITVPAQACVPLPDGVTAAEGAALFVNPLTVLAMLETLRLEGRTGLVHTAAASNLGQMLVQVCREDRVPLVNVVRRPEQVELLRRLGAEHVCDSSAPSFRQDLVEALKATRATVAFDALGGGRTGSHILAAIETAALSRMTEYGAYGSAEHKQLHIYGRLDAAPMELAHGAFGPSWGVGGWVMTPVLEQVGPARTRVLQARVVAGIRTTFASRFRREISLADALRQDLMIAYGRKATGEKYLINPTLGGGAA
jgi:NADPH:quinone reductase-like Zn-dependent oxidoreductase